MREIWEIWKNGGKGNLGFHAELTTPLHDCTKYMSALCEKFVILDLNMVIYKAYLEAPQAKILRFQ